MVRKLLKFLVKTQEDRIQEAFSQITLISSFLSFCVFTRNLYNLRTIELKDEYSVFHCKQKTVVKKQPNDALTWRLFFLISLHYTQLCADSTTMTQFPLLFFPSLNLLFRLRAYASSLISLLYFIFLSVVPNLFYFNFYQVMLSNRHWVNLSKAALAKLPW